MYMYIYIYIYIRIYYHIYIYIYIYVYTHMRTPHAYTERAYEAHTAARAYAYMCTHRRNSTPRPQLRPFSKFVFLIEVSQSYICLN